MRWIIAGWLRILAQFYIAFKQPTIVAVAGSVGKTTTKLAIAHVLSTQKKVLVHQGNYNSEFGVPMALFDEPMPKNLRSPWQWMKVVWRIKLKFFQPFPYDVAVLELGTDQPGDIAALASLVRPQVAVVTAVSPEHMEFFGKLEAVAREELTVANYADRTVVGVDDIAPKYLKEFVKEEGRLQRYGIEREAWVAATDLAYTVSGSRATITAGDVKWPKVRLQVIGRQGIKSLLAAVTVAKHFGLDDVAVREGIATFQPVQGRMRPLQASNGAAIIDDTYNSSPNAAFAALEVLYERSGRKIAIMGRMNELGSYSPKAHRKVGEACGELDELITIGDDANEHLAAAARKAGLKKQQIHQFDSPYAAGEYLASIIKKKDVVLAKGSQNGVFAEEALKAVLPKKQWGQLVRQSPEWMAKKQDQFGKAPY